MNVIHDMKDWSHHLHWPHVSDIKMTSGKMVHSPVFWLMVALLAFLAVMILLSLFATGGGQPVLPQPYYLFGGGGYPVGP